MNEHPAEVTIRVRSQLVLFLLLSFLPIQPTLAQSFKGVTELDKGFAFQGGPVKAGHYGETEGGKYFKETVVSRTQLTIDFDRGTVKGEIVHDYKGRARLFGDKDDFKPTPYTTTIRYELVGEIDVTSLGESTLIARSLIRGKFTHTDSSNIEGRPQRLDTNEGEFVGLICKNVGKTIKNLPEVGESFIVLYANDFRAPYFLNDETVPESDRREWLDRAMDEGFELEQAIGIVAADFKNEMPAWLVDASVARFSPRSLIDGTFKDSSYRQLIQSIPERADHVRGAACDGATHVWVMVECPGTGRATFSIQGDTQGGLCRPETLNVKEKRLEVATYWSEETERHYGFGLYSTPQDFGSTSSAARTIYIGIKWEPDRVQNPNGKIREQEKPVTLVRAPVILQHGTYDNADYCWRQYPQDEIEIADYPPDHGSMYDFLLGQGFRLPDGKPAVFTVNYENEIVNGYTRGKFMSSGLQKHERTVEVDGESVGSSSFVNLSHVLWENPGGIRDAIQEYRKAGLAATQADVICHSLGGLVARLHIRGAHLFNRGPQKDNELPDPSKPVEQTVWYYRPDNFMKGDVHRLITLCTTHKGSDAPGMLIPYQVLSEQKDARALLGLEAHAPIPTLRAADLTEPGDIGILDRKLVEVLLHFVAKDTGMGGAFIDQQPGSKALGAIGPTPVPSHAIAGICQDEDLDTFKGFYWERLRKIYLLTPYDIIERVLRTRRHGSASYAALVKAGRLQDRAEQATRATMFSGSTAPPGSVPEFKLKNTLGVFRSVIFGNQTNDCTVRLESALGGLTPGKDATIIDHVLHGYAPTYPAVQKRILELLRGGFQDFNPAGFPPAGGQTQDEPPGPVTPPSPRPELAVIVQKVGASATRINYDKKTIEQLARLEYRAEHHTISSSRGTTELTAEIVSVDDSLMRITIDAKGKPALFHLGEADLEENRINTRLLEGTVRFDIDPASVARTRITTPAVVIENEQTSFTVNHDFDTQTTNVIVHDGRVRVIPRDGSKPYDLSPSGSASHKTPDPSVFTDPSDSSRSGEADVAKGTPPPTIQPPEEPFDREIIVLNDGTRVDVTTGRRTSDPPKGPFDREIIRGPRNTPWVDPPEEGPPRNLRTLVYHQLFDGGKDGFDSHVAHFQPMLSADGSRAVFYGKAVYIVDHDGSNLHRIGDVGRGVANAADITPNGEWITAHDDLHLYSARANGSKMREIMESKPGGFFGLRIRGEQPTIYLVTSKTAKVRTTADAPWDSIPAGILAIDPVTGGRRLLVDFELMSRRRSNGNPWTLSSSAQGRFAFDASETEVLAFSLYSVPEKMSLIYSWSAERGLCELARAKKITSLAISGDGTTVTYITRGKDGGLFAVNTDGSNCREVISATEAPADLVSSNSLTQLSYDGSLFLHGMENLLVRIADGTPRHLGPPRGSTITSHFSSTLYRLAMNRDGLRFIFVGQIKSPKRSLVSLALNPTDYGKAPRIFGVDLNPPRLTGFVPAPTLTANVEMDLKVTHAAACIFREAKIDREFKARPLRDDGKGGDPQGGDGIFTAVHVLPYSDHKNWTGSRVFRVLIQGVDEQNLAHGTAVDFGPWPIVPGKK